jgi:hypothetical protein
MEELFMSPIPERLLFHAEVYKRYGAISKDFFLPPIFFDTPFDTGHIKTACAMFKIRIQRDRNPRTAPA